MRISDWSSDVCSSDLAPQHQPIVGHFYSGDRHLAPLAPTLHPTQQDANADRPPRPLNDGLILMLVWLQQHGRGLREIGRAHVRTPVTNAHLVCRLLLEKKKPHHKREFWIISIAMIINMYYTSAFR